MGTSLRDQLLKKGLVDKKQVNKVKHQKHVSRKKNQGKQVALEVNEARLAQLAQDKLNKERNLQLNQEKLKRSNLAQIKQLITDSRMDLRKCDDPYYFKLGKKIKKIYVNDEISKKLSQGLLAIVMLNEVFEVVPAGTAEQITARDKDFPVIRHDPEQP